MENRDLLFMIKRTLATKRNVIVAGGTGAGKTFFIESLQEAFPEGSFNKLDASDHSDHLDKLQTADTTVCEVCAHNPEQFIELMENKVLPECLFLVVKRDKGVTEAFVITTEGKATKVMEDALVIVSPSWVV